MDKKKSFIMFKYLLPLILCSFLFAESISVERTPLTLDETFMVNNPKGTFDTTLSYTHKALLECSPKLKAVYKINSSQRLKVIPKMTLPSDVNFSCRYQGQTFNFMTKPFKVVTADYFSATKLLRLDFNDVVKKSSIAKGIRLLKLNKLAKTELHYTIKAFDGKYVVLKIDEKLEHSPLKLVVTKELKTAHGTGLKEQYEKLFNSREELVKLDSEKEKLLFSDVPQMVALKNGKFALRIFVADDLTKNPEKFIEIEGIERFQLTKYQYMGSKMREKYHISNSYYYHDVLSNAFQPNHSYTITLKKGLTSYNKELKEDLHYTLKAGDRAKAIIFEKDKLYISNHGELGFSSVNIDKATLIVERLLDENLRYFMNFDKADTKSLDNYTQELFSKELTLNLQKNQLLEQKFKLSDLSKDSLPVGVYKVTLRFEEKEGKKVIEKSSSKVLFLSNLAISAKIGREEAFVTVLSLDKATPIKNATVQIFGENNGLIAQATTNQDGVARLKNRKLLTLNPKGVIVSFAKDKNFLALTHTINSPSAKEILQKAERFKAFVYFQSNIVRPQAKIHALVTIKDRDFISGSKLPIKLIFREHHGKTLLNKVYHTDEYGLIDFNYQLDSLDKTGEYLLQAYIGNQEIGSKVIKVEAFVPPKIENTIRTAKNIYGVDELMDVNISSAYLFGAPASLLHGTVKLYARPISYRNKTYKNFSFTNTLLKQKNTTNYLNHKEEIILNEEGYASLLFKNKLYQKVPSILEVMIGATIMDDTQPVSSYKKLKLYPYRAMVGVQVDKSSLVKGEKVEGKVIVIDPVTSKPIERELNAVIKKIEWHYNFTEGNYNWDKEVKVVDSFSIHSNQRFSRDILENGDHIIEISDPVGGHSATQSFEVWWSSYSNISPKNNLSNVEIKFEDKLYQKGDEIEIEIKSPILEGQLYLTLEDERVENYKLLQIKKGVAKTSLKINSDIKRGLYLHATVIRATNRDSKLVPFRATGDAFIKANREKHRIEVELTLPSTTKSKIPLSFGVKTNKSSKVLISIVDRGILQLVEQKSPNLFDYFNQQPNKALSNYDLYDQLLSYLAKGKLVDFGAGDALSKKQKHLSPDLGKRIKPFMIWSGVVELKEGEGNITVDIPEFNGRASVVVIAIDHDGVGVVQKDIVVKDDIMIKPSYPLYTLNGDEVHVPIRLFNTTKEAKKLTLRAKVSDNLTLNLTKKEVAIPANSSKLIASTLLAKAVGKGKITLVANDGKEEITKEVELPVYSAYALSTKTFKGISGQKERFSIPTEYQGATAYITLSNNLIGALRNDLKYLVQYPYGCAEQTASKLSAMHFAQPFFKRDTLLKESQHFILQGVKKLDNMQNYWGEFTYWEGEEKVNPYASLYAGETILEIADNNSSIVREKMKKSTLKMLKSVASASGSYRATYTNFHRLYSAYILAQHHQLNTSTANLLYEKGIYKKHLLATLYMSAILKMQGDDKKAEKLFAKHNTELLKYAYKTYGEQSGNFESNVRDMMLHFIVKTNYFNKEKKDLIALQNEFEHLYSTQERAIALKAISTYLGKPKSSKLNVLLTINGQKSNHTKPITMKFDKLTKNTIELNPNGLAMSYTIELIKHLPKAPKNTLSTTKKLSIKRAFINAKGEAIDVKNLVQGKKIFSKITLANYGKISHVVVNQRIPACMQIVNNNIKNQEPHFKDKNIQLEHREILDDRILYFINLKNKSKWNKALKKNISIENRGVIYMPLMVTTLGECKLPAVIVEAMYDPRIGDYAKEVNSISVKRESETSTTAQPKVDTSKAEALVKELYMREMNSNNALEFVHYFEFPLSIYFRSKNFTKEALLKDKSIYFKNWTKRIYSNIETTVQSVDVKSKRVQVGISFDYRLYNGKKVLKGTSHHLLTVGEPHSPKS